LEDIIAGFNVSYNFECEYFDVYNKPLSCSSAIKPVLNSKPNKFLIEFVTTDRSILKSFQIDEFFLMFDTSNFINILGLTANDATEFSSMNANPMVYLAEIYEFTVFGCVLNGFVDIYEFNSTYNSTSQTINAMIAY
jgi:hypothetical protein